MSTYSFSRTAQGPSGRDASRLLYISQDQYSPTWNSSLHTHGCAELFFITDGHGRFRTQDSEFPVSIRDLIIINTNIPHTELSQWDSPLEYIVLGVENLETMAAGAEGYTMLHLHHGWDELMSCLHLILREAHNAQPGYEEACRSLLRVVLIQLERLGEAALSAEAEGRRASRECDQVRRYIDNHFKEDLKLDQLAELAHLNKFYLAHAFRQEFGTSPINYLISRRIAESRFLLRETDHNLSLIAQIVGFSSPSYFSQCFSRVEGVTPMEYRKRRRGGA
mgnify:CR=1 FL=1